MTEKILNNDNGTSMPKTLSPLAVWALAYGCAVGWGSFVMPGTTFLPDAGPLGAVLGLFVGALLMALIGYNYFQLMKRYPDAGGAYSYAKRVLGFDHGFLCAWMLMLTYIAIIWANSTALSLIVRYLFGDFFCFGFSYEIAGYTVWLGEVLLSGALLWATGLICALSRRWMRRVQTVCAVLLFVCVAVCFGCVTAHNGGFAKLLPLFAPVSKDPAVQVIGIVLLAPWAFVGFESVSHAAGEFRFPVKKSLPVIFASLVTGGMTYIMLTVCAALATPDGFSNWSEYLSAMKTMQGVSGLPTFFAAQQAMGTAGLLLLGIAALSGITTGLIANYVALSRLLHAMGRDGIAPKRLGQLSKKGVPAAAVLAVTALSTLIPLMGRTAIGWIVDVTTVGAAVIYAYTSIAAFVTGRRERKRQVQLFGAVGTLLALTFVVFYLLPNVLFKNHLATESYLLLVVWCLLGMVVFRVLIGRDGNRRFGRSVAVWVILLMLMLLVSLVWIIQVTSDEAAHVVNDLKAHDADGFITESIGKFRLIVLRNVMVQVTLISGSMSLVFSIFSIIKRREQHLEAQRVLAEESSKAKSAFLSNMSHDIRTPMNAITGYTTLALKEADLSDTARGYLEKIDTSGQHLLSLINDILDMSRIESGKMELDVAPADLKRLLDEAEGMFAMQMAEKKLRFTVDDTDVRHRYVVCDKSRLNRILLNLLSNACKYTPSGGAVTLTLTETGAADGSAAYELRVADTGIGMSPEFAEHVFDAFEREHTQTVSQIQGTGLGMSITKSLTELMGGTISVRTEVGKGTEFLLCLTFPLATEADLAPQQDNSASSAMDFSGMRLLLAEDNPINTEIACMILSQEGFAVDTAENGAQAVEMIKSADADTYRAVLMDIQMPVMNGYEACRAIRALGGVRGSIPVIAMTANTFEDDRRTAYEAGMNAHIGKPFQPDELLAALAAAIQTTNRGEEKK